MNAMEPHNYDVVIVGGGAAGLSAALVLGRARRRVAVIDAGAPRNAPAAHMQGFLSRDGMPPLELLAAGRDEVVGYGVHILDDTVTQIEPGFVLGLASGVTIAARRLLMTTGVTDDLPTIAGVRARWGRDLLHCPYCHGWEVRDQPVGVLGTDARSVEHAHLLRQWSDDVTFFTHMYELSASERQALGARRITVIDGRVARFTVLDDQLHAVELADGRLIPRAAVFMVPTMRLRAAELIGSLGCELDGGGFVRADPMLRTSVPGVWVAGNAANPRAQVITAAGEGSTAAIAINADLVQEDVQTALRGDTVTVNH
jgi:thioredoxin reductase